jgi:choline/ethanolamine kinase
LSAFCVCDYQTLSASDLRDEATSELIATKLKEFHDLQMPGAKEVRLWDRLRNWIKTSKEDCTEEEKKLFRLDEIEGEINLLERELLKDENLVGYCHNDAQYGNIMIDEETNSITIIDYEYASYNPIAYDIANHFCEMAADYHTDTPHILDYSKYPGLKERRRFVEKYLSASGAKPSESEVEKLLENVEKHTLASHLLWGLWGIISEHFNEIDFDYMEYAKQRFEQYWLRKPDLLHSVIVSPDADGSMDGNYTT